MANISFMKIRLGNIFLAILVVQLMLHGVFGNITTSTERIIRKLLLDDYDAIVLPSQGSPVDVQFGFKLNRLVKVDSKEQLISVDTWVVMSWYNSFLTWNKDDYNGRSRINVLPSEVWFPDIALYNNGDGLTPRAGGRTKFLSNVMVQNNGRNVWSGPASFTASCDLNLDYWPFDTQECSFSFGSFSYHSKLLTISPFATKSALGGNFVVNGDWGINSVDISTDKTDHGNCCPYEFSQITYTIKMTRQFDYQLFYVVAPCLIMTILTLISFWIPSESGERIGFVTTLLLGMMVFLLIVPDSLPESSKSIPVLGILLMCTLVLISAVLVATIVVLRCFHATGIPPKYLRWLSKSTERNGYDSDEVIELGEKHKRSVATLSAVQPFPAAEPEAPNTKPAQPFSAAPSWQGIASRLDCVFFWIFLVVNIIIYAVLLASRA